MVRGENTGPTNGTRSEKVWEPLLYAIWTPPFNQAPFKSLINDFPCSLNEESGRASHLVHKFDKQIARCNNYQIKILSLLDIDTNFAGTDEKVTNWAMTN